MHSIGQTIIIVVDWWSYLSCGPLGLGPQPCLPHTPHDITINMALWLLMLACDCYK